MRIFIATVKPYSRYRAGQPWAGVVVRKENFHAAESRYGVDMRAGLFEGTAERGGRLYVEAESGDVIAWGQQGIRYSDTGENHGRIRPDGSVETLPDKAAAYRLLDAAAAMGAMKETGAAIPAEPVQPAVPEDAPDPVQDNPAPQTPPSDPVQPVVPEDAASDPAPQETSEDPVQPVVPEDDGDQGGETSGDIEGESSEGSTVNPFGHD